MDQQLCRPPQHEILPVVRVLHYALIRDAVSPMCALILQFIDTSQHSITHEPQGKFHINDTYCLLYLYVKLELPIRLHWKHFGLRRGSALRLFHFRLTIRANHIHRRQLKLCR